MSGKIFLNLSPPPPTFLGKIVARNKNLLHIDFGRANLADTPRIKKG
jgi:hypothetical protein